MGGNHESIHGVVSAAAILTWRGLGQKDNPLVSSSVFVYVCGSPAVACFCRVVDGCVNGGDVILSKVTCDSGN